MLIVSFDLAGKRAHQRPDRRAEVPSHNHWTEGRKDQRSSRQVPRGDTSPQPSLHFISPVPLGKFVLIQSHFILRIIIFLRSGDYQFS